MNKLGLSELDIKKLENILMTGSKEDVKILSEVILKSAGEGKRVSDFLNGKVSIIEGAGNARDDFSGTLRGEKVELPGVKTKDISYTKNNPVETAELRKIFNTTERKNFLINLSKEREKLKKAGLSDDDIMDMEEGLVPDGWNVHHKLPLDAGGSNSFDNLVLIKNEPYHKTITNFQNSFSRQLKPGDIKSVEWPIPEGSIYPPGE